MCPEDTKNTQSGGLRDLLARLVLKPWNSSPADVQAAPSKLGTDISPPPHFPSSLDRLGRKKIRVTVVSSSALYVSFI